MQAIVSHFVVCNINDGNKLFSSTVLHNPPINPRQVYSQESGMFSQKRSDNVGSNNPEVIEIISNHLIVARTN